VFLVAERYDEALALIAVVRGAAARERPRAPDALSAGNLELREAYAIRIGAQIATRRGEYRKAIDELEPLVVRYGELGAAQSPQVQSDLLALIAEAQRKLGQVDEAKKTY